jgi:hypothetical protein
MNEAIEEISSALEELDVAQREIFRQNRNLQTEVNPIRISWMGRPATLNFVRNIAGIRLQRILCTSAAMMRSRRSLKMQRFSEPGKCIPYPVFP